MRYLKTTLYFSLLLVFTISCNDTTDISKDGNQPFWNVLSVESIKTTNSSAKSFLSKNKGSNYTVNKDELYLMKLKLKDKKEPFDVVVGSEKPGKKTKSITLKKGNDTQEELKVDETNLYYISSLDKTVREEIHIKDAEKKSGIARYSFPDGSQLTLRVENGLPVEQVNLNEDSKAKVDCLDCGTSECYKTAKDACDSGADCKTLCDGLDWAGGWCTGAIMTSCFIYNNT